MGPTAFSDTTERHRQTGVNEIAHTEARLLDQQSNVPPRGHHAPSRYTNSPSGLSSDWKSVAWMSSFTSSSASSRVEQTFFSMQADVSSFWNVHLSWITFSMWTLSLPLLHHKVSQFATCTKQVHLSNMKLILRNVDYWDTNSWCYSPLLHNVVFWRQSQRLNSLYRLIAIWLATGMNIPLQH